MTITTYADTIKEAFANGWQRKTRKMEATVIVRKFVEYLKAKTVNQTLRRERHRKSPQIILFFTGEGPKDCIRSHRN
jgi:uncharacterized protein (DUF2252 family)